jgi:hypothetical protein
MPSIPKGVGGFRRCALRASGVAKSANAKINQ